MLMLPFCYNSSPASPQQTRPGNQEQVLLKDPKERRASLDDRRKIVAEHTSVTKRSLKIPGD